MNVAQLGTSDNIISGKPETTYFIKKYSKKTHFSSQLIKLQFPITSSFGEEVTIDLYQEGDLINNAYVSFTYPPGQPSTVCDSFGTYMFNWIQLEYGDQIIERIDGEFLEIMNDLTVPQTNQGALSNLVGKYITSNLAVYYVKLDFSVFTPGLPVCALKENPRLRFSLRNFQEGCYTATAQNPNFAATLFVNYVFLPESERNYFIKNPLTQLFEQTQRYDLSTFFTSNVTIYTEFQNPTKELFFVIQDVGSSPYTWSLVSTGAQQLVTMRMLLNNAEIITTDMGTPLFMRSLQGLENHTRCPDRYFYMYPFALDPENKSPSGSVNMSCLKQQTDLVLQTPAPPFGRTVHVYARSYNVLKIKDGLLRILYPIPFMATGSLNSQVLTVPQTQQSLLLALSNPGTQSLNTVASAQIFSLTMTNPYNLPIVWTYTPISGLSAVTTQQNIIFTVNQATAISQSMAVTATYGTTYTQTFTITASNNPLLVWGSVANQTVVTVFTSQTFGFNISNPYGAPITWSYTTISGLSAVTSGTGITFTVAQGTAINQTINVTASCLGSYSYPMSFTLIAVNNPGLVLANPGTQTLSAATVSQYVYMFLTNPYILGITWSYQVITGVSYNTSSSGIVITVAQGMMVSARLIITATCETFRVSQTFLLATLPFVTPGTSYSGYFMVSGVSATNTTTAFDNRGTVALNGPFVSYYPSLVVQGGAGQVLTFLVNIRTFSTFGYPLYQNMYVNYGAGWILTASNGPDTRNTNFDVTFTYTVPFGIAPGYYYPIVFQNEYNQVPSAPNASAGLYKTAAEYFMFVQLAPIVGGTGAYEIITGVSATNTTTATTYFDNRGAVTTGSTTGTFQYPYNIIQASVGQLLTFILEIKVSGTYSEQQNGYVNYGAGWILFASAISTVTNTLNVTFTYTVPVGTPVGYYPIAFQNNYASAPPAPNVSGSYKTVAEYVLQIV